MLNSFRSFAGSFFIKVLMAFLVLSFGMWGIGDVLRQQGSGGNVASVGGQAITQNEFARGLRSEMENLRRMLGKQFSPDLAISLQIPEHVLQMMVQKKLLEEEGYDIGIIASDAEILRHITKSPAFLDDKGQFSKAQFDYALHRSGTTEKKYLDMLRSDIASEQLNDIFAAPLPRQDIAVRTLYQSREATRTASIYTIPANLAKAAGEPTAEQLDAYYKAHAAEFTIPEYRKLSYITITAKDIPGGEGLSEEAQQDASAKLTNKIEDAFAGGSTLAEVAKQFGLKLATVGPVSHDGKTPDGSLNKEVPSFDRFLEVAFKTEEKSESQLVSVKGGGFYAIRVESITPEHMRPLADVKPQVLAGWQKQERAGQIDKLSIEIAQKFAADSSRAAAIKEYNLSSSTVSGLKPGKNSSDLPNDMLEEIFKRVAGQSTDAYANKDGSYSIAVVTAVTPAPLPEVGSEKYYEMTQATHSALNKGYQSELLEQYMVLLEHEHTVKVNESALKTMTQSIKE